LRNTNIVGNMNINSGTQNNNFNNNNEGNNNQNNLKANKRSGLEFEIIDSKSLFTLSI